ncbi:hypothetical protein BASA50_005707 [Batrachochytrium salamandrivorans]|uniref:Uncharacterized protein n=1 Tax=Batrachochytrium salamandrivorans TaxID=1357716 RepID=A0ABQ8FC16_9FUNG|nr:hypothetical protein BASA62_008041 [Batrachochytrium salamandrivorans]KAH6571927.1 hypothetical protein BASA60_006883 [Batrachochytrium salamandrivorans]KAH6595625.1 hypothetical protein BASA50_005707 [Batrachochytrium salamandrivorans]KAH9246051.1 hypothetical protein BASA81_016415 [Batrachochytrium salamandrivorans]
MKFHAFSLIAMFMVTANALVVPMDSMGDAPELVKRQDPAPTSTHTDNSVSTFTDEPTPTLASIPTNEPTHTPVSTHTDEPTHVLKSDPTHTPIFSAIL